MKRIFQITIFLPVITCWALAGWVQQVSGTTVNLKSVVFNHGNENMAWTCGENGTILFTTNGGANWVQQVSGTTVTLNTICYMEVAGGPIMAVGDNGTILRTTNFGTNWVQIPSPTTKTLRDISDYFFIAVGDSGTIIKSTNNGLTWSLSQTPGTQRLNACAGLFNMLAVGDSGTVWKTSNSGLSWTNAPSGRTENLYGLPVFSTTDIVMADNGIILRSSDFGVSWFSQPSGTNQKLRSVEFSNNNESHIYACGYNGTILKTTNYGNPWGTQISGTNVNLNSLFFYLNDLVGYCAGDGGTILKTTDGGGTIFTSVNVNTSEIPKSFSLEQNYPNPFNPSTKIKFNIRTPLNPPFQKGGKEPIASDRAVRLIIYDALGKEITTLVNEQLTPGSYEVDWNAADIPSGVYFYRLDAGGFSETKRMVLLK